MSPLLFALAIEPLAIALRSNPNIKGIIRNGVETKISLYADDLLLYVTDLNSSAPIAIDILNDFGCLSGYKLNFIKSELFPVNSSSFVNESLGSLPFKFAPHSFTYLGIQVTQKYKDLFAANFTPLLTRVKEDFERWSILGLSLVARINCVKMNVLPRFSYLFQCIPIFLTQSFFRKLDFSIREFLWAKKVSRLRIQYLQKSKKLGGMALPNFKYYYWACNIRTFRYWIQSDSSSLAWLTMETNSVKPVSLAALLHSPIKCSTAPYTGNDIVRGALKIWFQFRRHFGFQSFSLLAPLACNHAFLPSLRDGVFVTWARKGIKSMKDLYINNTFASFQQISERYSLPQSHFFRYLQVRSFVLSMFTTFPNYPGDSPCDVFLQPLPSLKGAISNTYNQITLIRPHAVDAIRGLWEEDLGQGISEELWSQILLLVHKSSICARHSLIQCKLLHRIYYTKARLAKMYPNTSPNCDRCNYPSANLIHTLWLCPQLFDYWTRVFSIISEVVGQTVTPNPLSALFGITPLHLSLPSSLKTSIAFMTLLARRAILTKWKSPHPPSHVHWLRDLLYFLKLEKIRSVLKDSDDFNKVWNPLFHVLKKMDFPGIPD